MLDVLPPAVDVAAYMQRMADAVVAKCSQAASQQQGVVHLSCDANSSGPEVRCLSPVATLVQVPQQALYHASPSLCILQWQQAKVLEDNQTSTIVYCI